MSKNRKTRRAAAATAPREDPRLAKLARALEVESSIAKGKSIALWRILIGSVHVQVRGVEIQVPAHGWLDALVALGFSGEPMRARWMEEEWQC